MNRPLRPSSSGKGLGVFEGGFRFKSQWEQKFANQKRKKN